MPLRGDKLVTKQNDEHDDFAARLLQIEEQANMALNDLPAGLTRDRVQHIAIVARMLRYRLDVAAIVVLPREGLSKSSPRRRGPGSEN